MNVRRLSGAVVCAVAVWSLWACTAMAAGRTRPVVSAAYGVLRARALEWVLVRVARAWCSSHARGRVRGTSGRCVLDVLVRAT
jgi:hypothetical protein